MMLEYINLFTLAQTAQLQNNRLSTASKEETQLSLTIIGIVIVTILVNTLSTIPRSTLTLLPQKQHMIMSTV